MFAVYHSPGCTASVTSMKRSVSSLKLNVVDYADLVKLTVFGFASAGVCTSLPHVPARFILGSFKCGAFTNVLVVQPT